MKEHTPVPTNTRYSNPRDRHPIWWHPAVIAIRCALAFVLALLLAPLTAPALSQSLPACLPVRLLERLAVRALAIVASLAAVEVVMRPRSEIDDDDYSWLPAPLVRFWTSPLPKGRFVRTYDQPGRWMTDEQLAELLQTLAKVAQSSIGESPAHRLFDEANVRDVFANRVVSVAYDKNGPLGFTAMVYLHCPADLVVHLGLTMISQRGRGKRLQSTLFTKSLLLPVVNLTRLSYNITNCAASPAGIGNVSDYFFDCYPSYDCSNPCKTHHVQIARHVLDNYRYEFGCSEHAVFDERCFVVYKSNAEDGGGTHQFIKEDGSPVSRHSDEQCNKFVASLIDFAAGDEIFQVAELNCFGSFIKYITSSKHRRSR